MGAILLATDGSDYARHAARHAIEIADEEGATLHVICVVDQRKFDDPALSSAELATIYAQDHATMTLSDVVEMADGYDVVIEGDTRHGVPHEIILDYADEVDAATIIVGEHGDHDKHFAGVGRKVSELADREVVIVEAPST